MADYAVADRQAQPGPAASPLGVKTGIGKSVEQGFKSCGRDPRPGVLDFEAQAAIGIGGLRQRLARLLGLGPAVDGGAGFDGLGAKRKALYLPSCSDLK